ncbi:zinc finger C3H1 domain-containing protein [Gymnodraco acuticeps]|uniref:Zinc finger C3H1 domain-containing protein n=1 Tax=Gymnodraco acuticeps TaxID=8218 RepID=A0A6P8T136_GYMAC|nr:zinc finger C3H1 domain-containing protein [Gymnodraco acuticeps]
MGVCVLTERYMQQLFGSNSVRMSLDQKAVLLVSKVNESRRHVPPFTTCKDPRSWRPSAQSSAPPQEDSEDESAEGETPEGGRHDPGGVSLDVCVSSEDKRYFLSETDDLSNLELSVLQSPRDTQLWIKLAFKYLQQSEACAAEGLEAALNTLSRALESNCGDPEVWSHYLSLFSRRGSRDELQQMCEMAVEHAPHYRVWWEFLTLEGSFEGKDFVCERLLQFLLMEAPPSSSQLMEAPPSSSLLMEAPPSSSQLMEAPPSSSLLMEAPPSSSLLMEAPPSSDRGSSPSSVRDSSQLMETPPSSDRDSSQLMEAPPSSARGSSPSSDRGSSSQLMEAPPSSDRGSSPSSDRGSSPSSDRDSSQLMEAPPSSARGSSPSSDRGSSSQLMEAPPSSDRGSSPSSDRGSFQLMEAPPSSDRGSSSQLMEAPPSSDRGSSPSSDRGSFQLMEAPPSSDRGSSPSSDRGSFQLMEALLYRVQLHLFSGRGGSALALLQGALKAPQLRSLLDHLSPSHRALLWLCFVHLTEFSRLPSLFLPAESGPGRLVSTESFLMPWRTPRDIRTPTHTLIQLFQDGVLQCSDERLSVSERMLACLPLHNNLLLLYRLLERYDEGVALCEALLLVCPDSAPLRVSLSELLLLRGDTEGGVNTWLTALTESPHNAELLYHCCCFLRAQERCSAIAPLVRCFMLSLCEEQKSVREPVDVLRQLLGFPSEELQRAPIITDLQEPLRQQRAYLHLIHCCWQRLHGSVDDTVDAYERALGSVLQRDQLHTLWMEYLEFSSVSLNRSKRFSNLIHRCLSTVPSRLCVPFNPAEFWSCYTFHNKVVTLYLRCLPKSQHALVLERLRYAMPNNTELGLRLLHQEWQDGNMEHLKFQVRMLSSHSPKCLAYWNIAIAVEKELKLTSEVRRLYHQALTNLPLCAELWKDRLLAAAADGDGPARLRRLLSRVQQVGVSLGLSERLTLVTEDQ